MFFKQKKFRQKRLASQKVQFFQNEIFYKNEAPKCAGLILRMVFRNFFYRSLIEHMFPKILQNSIIWYALSNDDIFQQKLVLDGAYSTKN